MSPLVRFIIFSTAFVKGGAFLSLPFLTVYLQKNLGATPTATGLIVGLNPLMGMMVGFYGGYLSDIWGRRGILSVAALLCGMSYLAFSQATELWHFALINAILGASSGALQTSLRALVSDLTHPRKRATAFRLQYFAINVGSSVGPLIGAHLLLDSLKNNSGRGFLITGSLYIVFFFCFQVFDKLTENKSFAETKIKNSFVECVKILKNDFPFLLFLFGSVLMSFSYSQIDTLLPQHLKLLMGDQGIRVFSWLLVANSITVMLGLYPATWAAKKVTPLYAVIWGQIIMSIGFASLAFAGASVLGLVICMVFLTVGEVLAFSNWSIVVDEYAKDGLKGSYFGASGFSMVGNCVGPALGGLLYQVGGVYSAFCFLGAVSFGGIFLYLKADREKKIVKSAN